MSIVFCNHISSDLFVDTFHSLFFSTSSGLIKVEKPPSEPLVEPTSQPEFDQSLSLPFLFLFFIFPFPVYDEMQTSLDAMVLPYIQMGPTIPHDI